jgi:hypothetical protein
MLTIVTHAWIVDTVERQDIAVSTAGRENNELQKYRLTKFPISCALSGSAELAEPPCRRGVLGGDRKAPDTSGRQRGAIEARERSD